ncbi:TetR family transcriptional regulator [Streptomyces sp. Amel2xB2]|uniref:TetR/AcrR family transcriptional regulator C-terminal domain-containing protein n=1 Tax=Streptomyces sp. Amel2xB2 TaxID=1305829 RepID=UPI000DBF9BF6|nr:GntR family transcriptional regulator [Streptomyces sp. Amel2xB2]RAJ70347.1 TetR family transcriptional regulator [Streptomyces sp. Amel2xB2]
MDANGEPPYRRIAADVQRRIAAGELGPGDRVPSTRQLAAEWGVALATATKAMAALRQEGLVEARPRAGTVVAPAGGARPVAPVRPRSPARRPAPAGEPHDPSPERELTRESVTRAAIAIADAEGLAALSMRGVAARLGVAAMSPYRHVNGKGELVQLMAGTVYEEHPPPADAPSDWREKLRAGARSLWELHRAHPWLAQLGPLTRPLVHPGLVAYSEWMLAALDGHGLDPTTMFDLNVLLYSHVLGLAVHLEREAQAEARTGRSDEMWIAAQAPALGAVRSSGRFPVFTRLMDVFEDTGYDLRLDVLFELGLTALLDGMAPLVEGGPATPRRA